jgi:hypothetical protein
VKSKKPPRAITFSPKLIAASSRTNISEAVVRTDFLFAFENAQHSTLRFVGFALNRHRCSSVGQFVPKTLSETLPSEGGFCAECFFVATCGPPQGWIEPERQAALVGEGHAIAIPFLTRARLSVSSGRTVPTGSCIFGEERTRFLDTAIGAEVPAWLW